jgi:flagellar hook-associated protein 2
MATIQSLGIGSGIDVEGTITKLMALEKKPLTSLQTKATALDSKISAFGSIKSQMSTLSDAVDALAKAATWTAKSVASSNATAVSASVTSGSAASLSSFGVTVSQLARAQSTASSAVAAGTTVGGGTLSIQLGTWSADASPTFAAGSAVAVSVDIDAADNMNTIAQKINAAGAGVTATVLKDLSGERLLMRSTATGEATGFRVQAADDGKAAAGAPGLGALAFDNPAAGAGMAANPVLYGLNAMATINGIAVVSASNTLADTIPGVALTLSQVTTSAVDITASTDTGSMKSAVNAFVTAYNATNTMLNTATKYDPATKVAALLQGDATTTGLQNALRQLVGSASGGGALRQLSDLGISIASGGAGNLAVDAAKLDNALKNPVAVKQFFAAEADTNGGDATATGFATRMSAFTRAAIATSGAFEIKTTALQAQKTANGKDQDKVNDRLSLTETRLRKQYATLDTTIASLTALNTYVTQQITLWNKSTS